MFPTKRSRKLSSLLWVTGAMIIALLLASTKALAATQGQVSAAIPGSSTAQSDIFLDFGAGLAMFNGNNGWAINIGGLKEVGDSSSLFVGADMGLNFWNYSSGSGLSGASSTSGATAIQLLPTAIYRLRFTRDSTFFPYIGISMGPNVYIEKQTLAVGGVSQSSSNTSLLFELLFRPGFYTTLSRVVGLQVEGKLGILGSNFIFLPQASAVFAL